MFNRPTRRSVHCPPVIEACEKRCLLSSDVLTYHNDLARDGADLTETQLTTANVRSATFGKKSSLAVDGEIYAQPLYVSNLTFPKAGKTVKRNMVYVATQNDTVYAYDPDRGSLIWTVHTLGTTFGETSIPASDTGSDDITPNIGITGTPVIDKSTNTLYLVGAAKRVTNSGTIYVQRLYALDLITGAKKFGGPVVITASANGSGTDSTNGKIPFDPLIENQRMALTLVNGVVYIGWASHGDIGPYHGWIIGYSATTLKQVAVWNDTPNGNEGGIWQSGGGIAVDSSGNLFIPIGNGTFDANTGGSDYGDSLVKIPTVNNPSLTPTDSFTPFNEADLESQDADFGSTGVLLLPTQTGAHPHEAIVGGKQGNLYLVDRDSLGGFHNGVDDVVQTIAADGRGGGFDSPAYFNNRIFYGSDHGALESFVIRNGGITPGQQTAQTFTYPGVNPVISANGSGNGIVWITTSNNDGQAVLEAYEAANLSKLLYSSDTHARDTAGSFVKFTSPTIANGKVFVGTGDQLDVYGLLG